MLNRREFIKTAAAGGMALSNSAVAMPAPSTGYPIIDAHSHMGEFTMFGPTLVTSPDDIAASCKRFGITKMFVSHVIGLYYDEALGNKEVLDAVKKHPNQIGAAISFPTPYEPGILNKLERYAQLGVQMLGEVKFDTPAGDPVAAPLFQRAGELGMTILLHTSPADAGAAAENAPAANILLAHMGTGNAINMFDWRLAIDVARQHKNLYLETCTSIIDRGMIEEAVKALGPERIVFGTDFPLLDPGVMLAKIQDARINEEARRLILGGNMARLLESK